ncbi:MAG: aspartyl protease family protein [Saprospiraceae bacterium]|nr:aspartyl protease family protein [Saprospiraceae bacterium]MBK8853323.1 aspartyl protease family protein [Saprospiraceae bacterium]MBK9042092.1 aspartyl protease family protein [Saprospiraceae bacterium]MBP6694521.1 aspartyl protease family protein [Saprospiraceae bacterium]
MIRVFLFLIVFASFIAPLWGNDVVIPFKKINDLIIIEAVIENKKGSFILDTGSDALFIDQNNQNPSATQQTYQTLNGDVETGAVTIKNFYLGSIKKRNVQAFTISLSHLENHVCLDLSGIIGTSIINPHSIYIDFTTMMVHLYKNVPDLSIPFFKNEIDFNFENGVPVVKVSIQNVDYLFMLDSGASIHLIDKTLINNHSSLFANLNHSVSLETLNATTTTEKTDKYILSNLDIQKLSLKDLTIISMDFTPIQMEFSKPLMGILSLSGLSNEGIFIDFRNQKVYF